jgi:2-hydroxy-3-oxopropionate reductase
MTEPSITLRTGFVGLGVMGRPMATRLVAAGFPTTVTSRTAAAVDELVRAGATAAATPGAVALASDVVLVMVPETTDLEAVMEPPDGVLGGAHEALVIVAMGTHDPSAMPRLAARAEGFGAAFLDAPVSGGDVGAREGTLSIMVGGDETAFERARPVFEAMGSRVVHLGPSGAGQIAKAANQLIVGSTIEAVAEAFTLAGRAGLDVERLRAVLGGGFAASRILEVHGRRMLDRDFTPGGRAQLHAKDARIILALADELGVDLPGFTPIAAAFQQLVDEGHGDLDHSALITLLERRSPGATAD